MTDSPFDDSAPEEEKPDELPALPAGKPEEPVDPLLRLRQSLKDEESQTTDTQKSGGFLQRMASGFTPKKTTKKSKEEEEQVISPLGSKLSTNVPSSSSVAPSDSEEPKPAEEIQDELLEKRLGTPDQHDWRRSKSTFDDVGESEGEGDGAAEYFGGAFSPRDNSPSAFTTPSIRSSAISWEDAEANENAASQDPLTSGFGSSYALESSSAKQTEEKKTLASANERKTEPAPFISYRPTSSVAQKFGDLSRLEKGLLALLVVVVIVVVAMIAFLYTQRRTPVVVQISPEATASPTIVSGDIPIPATLRLPGGFNFQLRRSTLTKGKWVPTGNEWLEGTEIRRVIGIPWTKQIEAVIQTLTFSDKIELVMSNNEVLTYKFQSVTQIVASDTSILYDSKPSLVVILFNPDDDKRWVVVAYP